MVITVITFTLEIVSAIASESDFWIDPCDVSVEVFHCSLQICSRSSGYDISGLELPSVLFRMLKVYVEDFAGWLLDEQSRCIAAQVGVDCKLLVLRSQVRISISNSR